MAQLEEAPKVSAQDQLNTSWIRRALTGRRGRNLREYVTGYAFILPSLALIFTFGLFPVGFALYVSLHKWKIKQGDFVGLRNFTSAIDSLAYLLFFAVAVGLVYLAIRTIRAVFALAQEHDERPWAFILPGILHAGSVILILRYVVLLAPEVLGIADKVRGLERSRELFVQLFGEALRAESVLPAFTQWLLFFTLAWLSTIVLWRLISTPRRNSYLTNIIVALTSIAGAAITTWFTWGEMQKAIAAALEAGTEVPIGIQVVSIAAGILLLILAWRLWTSAVSHTSDRAFIFRGLAALFLIIGLILNAYLRSFLKLSQRSSSRGASASKLGRIIGQGMKSV